MIEQLYQHQMSLQVQSTRSLSSLQKVIKFLNVIKQIGPCEQINWQNTLGTLSLPQQQIKSRFAGTEY